MHLFVSHVSVLFLFCCWSFAVHDVLCLPAGPPVAQMDNSVVISDYQQMDRLMADERRHMLRMCKAIKDTGCNVLLIQKSILRDAVSPLSLSFLAKFGIMVVTDIERDEIEFVSETLGCKPAATLSSFTADKLGSADECVEVQTANGKVVKMTGVPERRTTSILIRGSNKLVRSFCLSAFLFFFPFASPSPVDPLHRFWPRRSAPCTTPCAWSAAWSRAAS